MVPNGKGRFISDIMFVLQRDQTYRNEVWSQLTHKYRIFTGVKYIVGGGGEADDWGTGFKCCCLCILILQVKSNYTGSKYLLDCSLCQNRPSSHLRVSWLPQTKGRGWGIWLPYNPPSQAFTFSKGTGLCGLELSCNSEKSSGSPGGW